ncbi:MAG: transglutaminase domain-containing protein [Phaeodactylibacter sp.]|uniref:transglutaminase domain-containing protein n=1 Tax=Phaeodactylibacter sp. TaxID=1940289 RepID=UPI0032EEC8BE
MNYSFPILQQSILLSGLILALSALPSILPAQYATVDRYARQAPDSLSQNLPALAAYLSAPAQSETETARAIYTWVTGYLQYDHQAERQDKRINQNLRDILIRRKGLCMDYALLYQAICRYAGLQCEKIDGYAAPRLMEGRQMPEKADHSWNAVRINGQWQLLDATWNEVQDEAHLLYGTSYFFTPPEVFVLTHLPEQPMWQLLPCPVSTEAFAGSHTLLYQQAAQQDSCWSPTDSIAATLRLPPADRRVAMARQSHHFHPTPYTQRQWSAALFDRAVALDEQTESLPYPDSAGSIVQLRQQALADCQQALPLTEPQNWQRELYAQLLMNQAIARYQLPGGHPLSNDADATVDLLQTAREQLLLLPENGYFRKYAMRQCTQLLEQLSDRD